MTHILRTITKRFAPPQIRNAFHGCGYSMRHIRHTPIARVLGCFPRPVLLEVLGRLLGNGKTVLEHAAETNMLPALEGPKS